MKASIIAIGNSKGIRIPKILLKLCHIGTEVDLEVKEEKIILKPVHAAPRKGWVQAFNKMHENGEDKLLINDEVDLEMESWKW